MFKISKRRWRVPYHDAADATRRYAAMPPAAFYVPRRAVDAMFAYALRADASFVVPPIRRALRRCGHDDRARALIEFECFAAR